MVDMHEEQNIDGKIYGRQTISKLALYNFFLLLTVLLLILKKPCLAYKSDLSPIMFILQGMLPPNV